MDWNPEKGKRLAEGSFTVEASLIMGFVILCLMVCIYGSLYLHDKTILDAAAGLAAQKGTYLLTENQLMDSGTSDWERYQEKGILWRVLGWDEAKAIQVFAQEQTEGKLIVCREPVFTVSVTGSSVTVHYTADTVLPAMVPWGRIPQLAQISGTGKQSLFEEDEFVRLARAVLDETVRGSRKKGE